MQPREESDTCMQEARKIYLNEKDPWKALGNLQIHSLFGPDLKKKHNSVPDAYIISFKSVILEQ